MWRKEEHWEKLQNNTDKQAVQRTGFVLTAQYVSSFLAIIFIYFYIMPMTKNSKDNIGVKHII